MTRRPERQAEDVRVEIAESALRLIEDLQAAAKAMTSVLDRVEAPRGRERKDGNGHPAEG